MDIPLLDELRATRRRVAEEQALDVERYAAMLRECARLVPGNYVSEPFLPPAASSLDGRARNAG